jgi:basic membrane protein A
VRSLAVAAMLAAALLLLTSCGGGGEKTASTGPTSTLKVGLVTDIGQLNDRGFNHLAYVGLRRAERQLGVEGHVAESNSPADYIPNLSTFARRGYDLVIAVGFTETDAVDAAATRFPKTHFAIVDVSNGDMKHRHENVLGLLFREQEVGYLAGYLAGLVEKRQAGPDVIGSVGGQKQPPVDRFIAGYQAGATKADPGIKTLNGYSQDFVDQAKCKELALTQIDAGAGVVFQVAGGCGLGALDAARERQVWGIGVDADQSFLGPQILTSAVKRVDRAVYLAINSVADGSFRGGDSVYGLKQAGVGLGKISSKVPKVDVTTVRRIQADIVSGRIRDIPTLVR